VLVPGVSAERVTPHTEAFQAVVWLGLAISLWFYATSLYGAWDFFTHRRPEDEPSDAWAPPVTILKPLKGLDADLYHNLLGFCRQDS